MKIKMIVSPNLRMVMPKSGEWETEERKVTQDQKVKVNLVVELVRVAQKVKKEIKLKTIKK